ncbi:dethiobiotin synthase [Pontibacter sp. G13]|uniref:dethiobiotin synthase n=1 Tax=Pontibacter sp. G13 TaxID=3074898 RepID=UPI00288C4634|nr:dethiobiotin synthase [Pontibacter sp. G13]WNJ16837.1 dethiobiotin synthase [Pontibacter sp. G13]
MPLNECGFWVDSIMHNGQAYAPKLKCAKLYVAATSQHVGKTTTTLGLISALQLQGLNVGYCKPVGQKYVEIPGGDRVDKDAHLFSDFMGFQLVPELHSPVILGPGAVTGYLDNPEKTNYPQQIQQAACVLEGMHDVVVYEGTGHPGVGGVVDVSNADVAQMLGAGVIMVVEAGIGSTIDELLLNLALFQSRGVEVVGVIINKTRPEKMEKVQHYVGKKLEKLGIPILGTIPYASELGMPLMRTVQRAVKGDILAHPERMNNFVAGILAGSLIDTTNFKGCKGLLLMVSSARLGDSLQKLRKIGERKEIEHSLLSGLLVTGQPNIKPEDWEYINHFKIPVIHAPMDTYEAVLEFSRIEVKINTQTPWKVAKAVELFQQQIDQDKLMGLLKPQSTPYSPKWRRVV